MHEARSRNPPQSPPSFKANADSILEDTRRIIHGVRHAHMKIAEVRVEDASFSNVLLPLAHAENVMASESHILAFYKVVSPDAPRREASREAQALLDDFHAELNPNLFKLIDAVAMKQERLDSESARFLKKKHKNYLQNGFGVPIGAARERFREIKQRLSHLALEFRKNLTESDAGIWLTADELSGVSDDFLAGLEKGKGQNHGKLRLSFKSPDLYSALRYSMKADTRKRIYIANENQCNINIPLFRETVVLRDEAARLMGYPNHASFRIEDRMAQTPQVVRKFLNDLHAGLSLGGEEEARKMKAFKADDQRSRGEPIDGRYFVWDHPFYNQLLLEKKFAVNHQQISEYFPLQSTISGMLDIFKELFDLSFEVVRPEVQTNLVWQDDVQIFSVWDSNQQGGGFLGYLYMDLFPRNGKAGNAANYNIVPGFTRDDGSRNYPATALVCNFTQPGIDTDKPSLLKHDEVVMLFHELGHAIHDLVSKTQFACFHGTEVAVDFGEAPSQMLENWCWDPAVLKLMSRHYLSSPDDRPESYRIPDEMVKSLVQAKQVNTALFSLRQLALCAFDLKVHCPESREEIEIINISAEYNKMRRDILPLDGPEDLGYGYEWGHGQAKFAHLMGEYDAGYYSYLFSKVYSSDMFHFAFKAAPMNKQVGLRYRYQVLEKGGSQDEMKTLVDFLGREPSTRAFRSELGIS